jgi:hypothetical protein
VAAAAAAAAGNPYVFPYFDPSTAAGLVRSGAVPPGVRLLAPAAAAAAAAGGGPGLLMNGQGAPGGVPGLQGLNSLGLAQTSLPYAVGGSPSISLPGNGGRRDSVERVGPAFSPSLDKGKAAALAAVQGAQGWPYNLGLPSTAGGGLTPPPGSLAGAPGGINLLHARLSGAGIPGAERGSGGFQRNGNIAGGLFGSSGNLLGGGGGGNGGKHRHNSIDNKQANRSKLLEDFR